MVLTLCQILRIISFSVTQLPAPNYHCREGESTSIKEPADKWWDHILVDVGRQATHGCGDLIFSSHTTFVLVGCLTFTEYGESLILKIIAWIGVGLMSLCIVASRKHYSVDVIIAWYVVPLVFYTMLRRWTTKRPMQDYWPHRPLAGDEGNHPASIQAAAMDTKSVVSPEKKPLLPIVVQMATATGDEGTSGSNGSSSMANGLGRQMNGMKALHRSTSSMKLSSSGAGNGGQNGMTKASVVLDAAAEGSVQESTGLKLQGPGIMHQRRPSSINQGIGSKSTSTLGPRHGSASTLDAMKDIETGQGVGRSVGTGNGSNVIVLGGGGGLTTSNYNNSNDNIVGSSNGAPARATGAQASPKDGSNAATGLNDECILM